MLDDHHPADNIFEHQHWIAKVVDSQLWSEALLDRQLDAASLGASVWCHFAVVAHKYLGSCVGRGLPKSLGRGLPAPCTQSCAKCSIFFRAECIGALGHQLKPSV